MIEITDIKDDRVVTYSSLRKISDERVICDSEKVVVKLLKSNFFVESIFATEDFINEHEDLINSKICSSKIFYAQKNILEQITGHKLHHGVMACAESPQYSKLNELDDKILILNGVTSPENVGNLIRSATAFGVRSVIIDSKSVSPFIRRAIRVSMGNIFYAKVHRSECLKDTIEHLKDLNYCIYSAANSDRAIEINNCNFGAKSGVIIGSEGHGIEQEIIELSDQVVKIPVDENVAHLNAANAGTIFLYKLSTL